MLKSSILYFFFHLQMALDSKTIKEEILDKDIYEANSMRAKGESFVRKLVENRKKNLLKIKRI